MKKKTLGALRPVAILSVVASFLVACDDAESSASDDDAGAADATEDSPSGDSATATADDDVTDTADGASSAATSDAPSDDSAPATGGTGNATDDDTEDTASTSFGSSDDEVSAGETASDPGTAPSSSADGGTLPDPLNPDAGSGEDSPRLRQRYIVLEDGSQVFDTFVDTELGKTCRFMDTSNGDGEASYHCVAPIFASVSYLDAECTQPVVNMNAVACGELLPDRLVSVYFPSEVENCGGPQHLLTLGEALEADTVYDSYFVGQCNPRNATNMDLYAAAEPDFSQYVEGSLRTESLPDGLELQHMDSAEGDTQIWSFGVDGERCAPTSLNADSSEERCLPSSTTQVRDRYFAEASCSGQELAIFGATTCAAASSRDMVVRVEQEEDGCGQTQELRAISPVETPNPLGYQGTPEACFLYEPAFEPEWYALGANIDAATFPALETVELGAGQLRARMRTSASGEILNLIEWYDAELGTQCDPFEFSDGTTRCFANSIGADESYYSDMACTEPVYFAQESGCFTFPARPFVVERDAEESCYVIDRVFELESYDGPLYELVDVCQPAAALPEGGAVFVKGNEVPVTDFAELVHVEQP